MGAFDSIEASAPCPQCGDIYYLDGTQTKFFEPDYDDQRWMRPGEWHPFDGIPNREHSSWAQIRDPRDSDDRFTLLLDLDDMMLCECECPCASLLHFVKRPGEIMLERLEILDARKPLAALVDFFDGVPPWTGSWEAHRPRLRDFEQRPFAERAAEVHAVIAKRFERDDEPDPIAPWTMLVGPTRCEACGDTRERTHHTMLTHSDPTVGRSFFGPDWHGGAILIGDRVPFDEAHVNGVNRRRSPPEGSVTIAGLRNWWGCRCGAGRNRYVARFERSPDGAVLVDLALRTTDDLSDIDYTEF